MQVNVDFEKYITDKTGKAIFKMVKTKTNRYYLVDLSNNNIIANTKNEILQAIVDYKKGTLKKV